MKVKFQVQAAIGNTRWEFDGYAETYSDALMQGREKALEFIGVSWFRSLIVWDMTTDDGRVLAELRLGQTVVEFLEVAK